MQRNAPMRSRPAGRLVRIGAAAPGPTDQSKDTGQQGDQASQTLGQTRGNRPDQPILQ